MRSVVQQREGSSQRIRSHLSANRAACCGQTRARPEDIKPCINQENIVHSLIIRTPFVKRYMPIQRTLVTRERRASSAVAVGWRRRRKRRAQRRSESLSATHHDPPRIRPLSHCHPWTSTLIDHLLYEQPVSSHDRSRHYRRTAAAVTSQRSSDAAHTLILIRASSGAHLSVPLFFATDHYVSVTSQDTIFVLAAERVHFSNVQSYPYRANIILCWFKRNVGFHPSTFKSTARHIKALETNV